MDKTVFCFTEAVQNSIQISPSVSQKLKIDIEAIEGTKIFKFY